MVLVGVLAMRWNVVIGGQLFSKSLRGVMGYKLEFAGVEGWLMGVILLSLPFIILTVMVKLFLSEDLPTQRARAAHARQFSRQPDPKRASRPNHSRRPTKPECRDESARAHEAMNSKLNQAGAGRFDRVFLALTAVFLLNLLGRPAALPPIPLVDTQFSEHRHRAAVLRRSRPRRTRTCPISIATPATTRESRRRCASTPNQNLIVPKEHPDIVMGHGQHGRNNNCFNCHNETNLTLLQTRDGHEVTFVGQPARCAAVATARPIATGKPARTGAPAAIGTASWALTRNGICVNCHNPHSPPFPGAQARARPASAAPGGNRRRWTRSQSH